MAADQVPEIAEDGVQEASLTIARRFLTRLIEQALEEGLISAFTVRNRRRAYLVAPRFYEQARRDRAQLEAIHDYLDELAGREQKGDVPNVRRVVGEVLDIADRRAAENLARS